MNKVGVRITVKNIYKLFLVMFFLTALIGTVVCSYHYGVFLWVPFLFFGVFLLLGKINPSIKITLIISLILRLLVVLIFPSPLFSDYLHYHEMATAFIHKTPFGVMYASSFPHTVFYSSYIAFIYRIFGENPMVIYGVNIILGMGTLWLIYKLTNSKKVAFLYGIFPTAILYTSLLSTEIPCTFLLFSGLYLLKKEKYVFSGIIIGIMNLIRPTGIIFIIAYIIYTLFFNRKKWLKIFPVIISYFLIVNLFFSITENVYKLDFPKNSYGYTLFVGMNDDSVGRWNEQDYNYAMSFENAQLMHDTLLKSSVARFLNRNFTENLKLFMGKFAVSWGGGSIACFYLSQNALFEKLLWLFFGITQGFHLYISFISLKALFIKKFDRKIMLPILFVLGITSLHLLTETMERYVYPPFIMIIIITGVMKGTDIMFFKNLLADINAVLERDPASKSRLEVYLLSPGVKALKMHRYANFFWRHGFEFIAKNISMRARKKTGIEIHPAAKIGKGVLIDHGMGVVIGETAVVGDNCTIYQNVTLGGTGKDIGKRHPTIGSNVMIGAGAKVLGPFTVGDNSKIAANAVVLSEVPPDSTCVGVPARVVKQNNERIHDCSWQMDQTHIPDPVSQELCKLLVRIEKLEKKEQEK